MTKRYVSTCTSIYTDPDLRPWHPLTIYFYRYLYENDHANGLTGIGVEIDEGLMRYESKLTRKQIERAKQEMADKVVWFSEHTYWVVGRARHTCYTNEHKLQSKRAPAARAYVMGLPPAIRAAFSRRYPDIISIPYGNGSDTVAIPKKPTDGLPVGYVSGSVVVSESVKKKNVLVRSDSGESSSPPPPFREIQQAWNNSERLGEHHPMNMTDKRRQEIKTRWKEPIFQERWRELVAKCEASDFLMFKFKGFGFSWVVKNDTNYVKVLEGTYVNRGEKTYEPI